MTYTYSFALQSSSDSHPLPTLKHGWYANFYPINANTFDALNVHLTQLGQWFTVCNGKNGTTAPFIDLVGLFNNLSYLPVSYAIDFDSGPGPSIDPNAGMSHWGTPQGSTLVFGNQAGFLKGTYPPSFSVNSTSYTPGYSIALGAGTQSYSKSNPTFYQPYGVYTPFGAWSSAIEYQRCTCSAGASYRNSYNNVGTLAVAGTQSQSLASYTNVGYCALNDGAGTVAVFTDANGVGTVTTLNEGTDAAALAFVNSKFGGTLPSGTYGFMKVLVSQNYEDYLQITAGNDGVIDYSTLPQQRQHAVDGWAGLIVESPMSTQALYYITATAS